MTSAAPRLQTAEAFGLDPFREQVARGAGVLLQVMDSSKLGWLAPRRNLEHTLDRIAGVVAKIELLLAEAGAEFVES